MRTRILDLECQDHGKVRSLSPEGYALVGWPGRRSRSVALHRKVYAEVHGVSLDELVGVVIRHTCDNTRCIEPTHLIPGTRADNNRDRAERGRSAKRVDARRALTVEQGAAIKARYSPDRVGIAAPNGVVQMARDYGVDTNVILRVLRGTYAYKNL